MLRGGTLTDFTDTRVTAGSLILGYDTNPATIGARTDSTSYTAPVAAILINDEVVAFAPGSLSLTVDFDAGTMSGNADIDLTTSANGVLFQGFDLTLNEASISENGFRGNISLASGGITRTLVGGSYEGRFFGSEAESIGGNITGQFDELGMTTDTFLDGLFLGNQDDMTPPDPR